MVRFLPLWVFFFLSTMLLCRGISFTDTGITTTAFRLTVVPFSFPSDPDYGVFIADRIACELMRHSYFPPLQRRRFELIESDTLSHHLQSLIFNANQALPNGILDAIRQHVPANYLLTGLVVDSGIKTLHLKLIDLETGKFVWSDKIRDNPAWIWTGQIREAGDIPAETVRKRLGFSDADILPLPPHPKDLPRKILLQPLYTTRNSILASDCRLGLRNIISRDGNFSLVPGEIAGPRGVKFLPRFGATERRKTFEETLADAVICGSVLGVSKGEISHNVAVTLRLVDVSTGRILWSESAGGRRVWRWDRMADIVRGVIVNLTQDLAQFGSNTAQTLVSKMVEEAKNGSDWCKIGMLFLNRGLLPQAEEAFEKALLFQDASAKAYNGLGKVYLRNPMGLKKAVKSFQTAIQESPEFLEPYSNLAQGYLERDMVDGVEYAQKSIILNKSFSRPYRILGDWYNKNEDYLKALEFYENYLNFEPNDISVASKLGRILLILGEYDRIKRLIVPLLRSRPEATGLLPIVAIKEFKLRNYNTADQYFKRFLNQVEGQEKKLYTEISTILSTQQLEVYSGLSGKLKTIFINRFWRKKDPNLATEINERILEHYGRVWTARQEFGKEKYPWDKRGEVFIRFGEPDYRSKSRWIPELPPIRVQEVKERVFLQLYQNPPEGELIGPVFPIRSDQGGGFVDKQGFPQFLDRGEGIFSEESSGVRDTYAPVTMQNDRSIVPWESWVYVEIEGGVIFDFTKELGGIRGYEFAPIPAIPPSSLKGHVRLVEFAPEIAFHQTVSNTPDAFIQPVPAKLKGLSYDLVSFRTETWKTRLDLAYSVPFSELVPVRDGNPPKIILDWAVALFDTTYNQIYRQSKRVKYEFNPSMEMMEEKMVDLIQNIVPPGFYNFTMTVRDVISGRVGKTNGDLQVQSFNREMLQISDLMLVDQVKDKVMDIRFRRGGLEVKPKPDQNYLEPKNLIFYFEIYNLKKDEFGQSKYKVTTTVKFVSKVSKNRRLMGIVEHPEVGLSYDQVGDQEWERSFLEIDLKDARPGRNRLTVMIEDLNSRERVWKTKDFFYHKASDKKISN